MMRALLPLVIAASLPGSATAVVGTAETAPPPPDSRSCAAEPLRSTGKVFYVCACDPGAAAGCVAGSDSNAGTSPATPCKSLSKAASKFVTMNGGDTVALCRGGRWSSMAAPGGWGGNARCSAGSTCDLRDYAPPWGVGSEGAPTITVAPGADLFSLSSAHGLRFLNIAVTGGRWAFVTWDDVTDLDACNLTLSGMSIAMYVAASTARTARIQLRQSRITKTTGSAYLGACDECVIDSNHFGDNGTDGNHRDHNIYVGQNPKDGVYHLNHRMKVTNNELHGSSSAAKGGACDSAQLVVHGSHSELLIENNLVWEAPGKDTSAFCYGISVGSGRDVVAHFPKLVIRRNRVFNSGTHGIDFAEAPDALVEDNLVVVDFSNGQEAHGILVGEASTPRGSDVLTGATVRNNTVYYAMGTQGGDAVRVDTEGTGHVVTGNVVVSYSNQKENKFRCFNNGLPGTAYALLDRNACWLTAGSAGIGAGTHLLGGGSSPPSSLFVRPGADPATSDFTPASRSPLIGRSSTARTCTVKGLPDQPCSSGIAIGSPAWSASDRGKVRARTPTDVGAHER